MWHEMLIQKINFFEAQNELTYMFTSCLWNQQRTIINSKYKICLVANLPKMVKIKHLICLKPDDGFEIELFVEG